MYKVDPSKVTFVHNSKENNIIIGNGSNVAAAVAVSGDVTITNAGVTSIGNNKVITNMIANSNVTTAKLADDAVTTNKITDANITTAKLAANAVTSSKITDGTIVVGDLADNAVETIKIKNGNITNEKLDKVNIPLSGFGAATANVALGANKLTGVADPVAEVNNKLWKRDRRTPPHHQYITSQQVGRPASLHN